MQQDPVDFKGITDLMDEKLAKIQKDLHTSHWGIAILGGFLIAILIKLVRG